MDFRLLAIGVVLMIAGVYVSYYATSTVVSDFRELSGRQSLTYSRDLQNYPVGKKALKVTVFVQEGRANFYLLDTANLRLYQSFRPFESMISRPNMTGNYNTEISPTNNTIHFILDNNKGQKSVKVSITAIADYGTGQYGAILGIIGLGVMYFGLSGRSKRRGTT